MTMRSQVWWKKQKRTVCYEMHTAFNAEWGQHSSVTWVGRCWRVGLAGLRWNIGSVHRRFNCVQICFFLELSNVLLIAYSLIAKPIRDLGDSLYFSSSKNPFLTNRDISTLKILTKTKCILGIRSIWSTNSPETLWSRTFWPVLPLLLH